MGYNLPSPNLCSVFYICFIYSPEDSGLPVISLLLHSALSMERLSLFPHFLWPQANGDSRIDHFIPNPLAFPLIMLPLYIERERNGSGSRFPSLSKIRRTFRSHLQSLGVEMLSERKDAFSRLCISYCSSNTLSLCAFLARKVSQKTRCSEAPFRTTFPTMPQEAPRSWRTTFPEMPRGFLEADKLPLQIQRSIISFVLIKLSNALLPFLSREMEEHVRKMTCLASSSQSVGELELDLSDLNLQASGLTAKPHSLFF